MPRQIKFEGRTIQVPDDATDAEIAQILEGSVGQSPPAAPAAAAPAATPVAPEEQSWGDYAAGTAAYGLQGARKMLSIIAGSPVDIANNLPYLLNNPGEDLGYTTFSDKPFMGSQYIDELLTGPQVALGGRAELPPGDAFQQIVERVGREVGAAAIPVGGVLTAGARLGVQGARELGPVARFFVEPAAVAPAQFAAREAGQAVAAGTGAGLMNYGFGNPQDGQNFWTDFLGSMAGAGLYGVAGAAGGAVKNAVAGATGNPAFVDDVVGDVVAGRILQNSSQYQAGFADGNIDASPLIDQLRRKAPVEDAVPGYRANVGDRSQDPQLMTLNQNVDALNPGAANVRRTRNDQVVDQVLTGMAPEGSAGGFRSALQSGVDNQLGAVDRQAETAQSQFEQIMQNLAPIMPGAEERGAAVRGGLQNAEQFLRAGESRVWNDIGGGQVDPAPLAQAFDEVGAGLPAARRMTIGDLAGQIGIPASFLPQDPNVPAQPVNLEEITALRSSLTTARRNALAGPQPDSNRANVIEQYIAQIDNFMSSDAVPPGLAEQIGNARTVTRDVNEIVNRPGDPIARSLAMNEGRPVLPDSGVAREFVKPDGGQASNIDRLLAQTDMTSDAWSVRSAIRQEILADVEKRKLYGRPDQLDGYLDQYSRVFERFPDLRQELQQAGQSSRQAADARQTADVTRRDLTTPGRSPEASYLKYGDERVRDSVRTVINADKPIDATRQLLKTAGATPEVRTNLKAALWEEVSGQKFRTPGATGEERWDVKRIAKMFDEKDRFGIVAKELWSDKPEDLANIKQVFEALSSAEGSIRTRAAGSSGTPQALGQKFDPSLTPASIASRLRSVNRGVLSPQIAAIDMLGTWLRGRAAQVQSRAIDNVMSSVMNNPDMAADLLQRFNPADYAAKRRSILQKYGMRATQLLNLLDEAQDEDPTMDAITQSDEPSERLRVDITRPAGQQ